MVLGSAKHGGCGPVEFMKHFSIVLEPLAVLVHPTDLLVSVLILSTATLLEPVRRCLGVICLHEQANLFFNKNFEMGMY